MSASSRSPEADAARAARAELESLLETEAPALAAGLPPGFADAAERYVALLLEANRRLNLTRLTEPAVVARLHLLDALSALPLLDRLAPSRAVELGTGGGVPGIVLALARPQVGWLLVDSVAKKVEAVRSFAAAMGLANVEVLAERAEAMGRDPRHREAHDLVAARACAALPVLAEYALPLVRTGGALLAWKGALRAGEPELADGAGAAAQLGGGAPRVHATGLPALGERCLVLVEKVAPTPARFPRRPGEPSRQPLSGR